MGHLVGVPKKNVTCEKFELSRWLMFLVQPLKQQDLEIASEIFNFTGQSWRLATRDRNIKVKIIKAISVQEFQTIFVI